MSDGASAGNFKGVMLCNRPALIAAAQGNASAAVDHGGVSQKPPFVSSVTAPKDTGLNPLPKTFEFKTKKNPEDDPTWRHKKWLKEFAERRHDMIDMVEEKVNEMETKKQRFREKQAAARAAIRATVNTVGNDETALTTALQGEVTQEVALSLAGEDAAQENAEATIVVKKRVKKLATKPRWAMTEAENEAFEDQEVDDLLAFAEGLDYDQYEADTEAAQEAAIRRREEEENQVEIELGEEDVDEYEEFEEEQTEEQREQGVAPVVRQKLVRRVRRSVPAPKASSSDERPAWDSSSSASRANAGGHQTKEILNAGFKGVHSHASVHALLNRRKDATILKTLPSSVPQAVPQPVIATSDSRVSLVQSKAPGDVHNLPFKYRHPGI